MTTLTPGVYKFRYQITGFLEGAQVKTSDLIKALNQAIMTIPEVSRVTEKGVHYEASVFSAGAPKFAVYIKINQSINISKWNNKFLSILRKNYPWYHIIYFHFIDYQKVKPEIARQETEEQNWLSKLGEQFFGGGITSYIFFFSIVAIAVYGITTSLGEEE